MLKSLVTPGVLGKGILSLVISDIRQLTSRIRAYELRAPDGQDLPLIYAGAHLKIPVLVSNEQIPGSEKIEWHFYSICSSPAQRELYEIAVQCENEGSSIAKAIQDSYILGLQINCEIPGNHFHLHADSSPAILIAGGIGITPLKPMAQTLALRGRRFQLHYAGRSLKDMAFSDCLASDFNNNFFAYPADQNKRLAAMEVLSKAPHNALFYVCGPDKLMDDVYRCARLLGIAEDRIQSEKFSTVKNVANKLIIVELARSNKLICVAPDQPILAAVRDAGIDVNFDCCVGDCGTCAVQIIEGEAEHRDQALSDKDRANGKMCICVSRAKGEKLILDL